MAYFKEQESIKALYVLAMHALAGVGHSNHTEWTQQANEGLGRNDIIIVWGW